MGRYNSWKRLKISNKSRNNKSKKKSKSKSKNKNKNKNTSKITKNVLQRQMGMLTNQLSRKTMITNNKATTIQKIVSAKILHWWSKKITLPASLHFLAVLTEIKYSTQHLYLSRGISLLMVWEKYRAKQYLNNNTIIPFYPNLRYTLHKLPNKR